jgi:hypothetical protein
MKKTTYHALLAILLLSLTKNAIAFEKCGSKRSLSRSPSSFSTDSEASTSSTSSTRSVDQQAQIDLMDIESVLNELEMSIKKTHISIQKTERRFESSLRINKIAQTVNTIKMSSLSQIRLSKF